MFCNKKLNSEKIKMIHVVSRKIYNSMPTKENFKFLDVSLDVTSYNCGLFKFDWELLKMILAAEGIYVVTLTQFQKVLT